MNDPPKMVYRSTLKNRVTYTFDDSLGSVLTDKCIAGSDGDNVSIAGLDSSEDKIKKFLNDLLLSDDSRSTDPDAVKDMLNSWYIELQYHGEIAITDVQSVCFEGNPPEDIVTELKQRGVTVYAKTKGKANKL